MSIKSEDIWISFPDDKYESYLLFQTINNSIYLILSSEEKGIIYRNGFFEAGGYFQVYRCYKGTLIEEKEGFGSPTNEALYIGEINNVLRASTNYDIYDLVTREILIYA